jgi:hypothetical protein
VILTRGLLARAILILLITPFTILTIRFIESQLKHVAVITFDLYPVQAKF